MKPSNLQNHTLFTTSTLGGTERYWFGFNGKENITEVSGWQDYGERFYNTNIARFFSPDPIIVYAQRYPWYSPYQFAGNTPIQAIDWDGLEEYKVTRQYRNGQVISKTQFVPKNSRDIIGHDNNGNPIHRGGVDYIITNGDGSQIVLSFDDFIQGSKEASHPRLIIPFYLNEENAKSQTNLQRGKLGDAQGNAVAQGKITHPPTLHSSGQYKTLAWIVEIYDEPNLQEYYSTDDYSITTQALNASEIAYYLIMNPTYTAVIEGHTDRQGSSEYNVTLSQNRANEIREEIINSAITSGNYSQEQINSLKERVVAIGLGEENAGRGDDPDAIDNAEDRTTNITIQR